MKKWAVLVIMVIFLWVFTLPAYAQDHSLSISVSQDACLLGEEITVEVIGSDLDDIAGADIGLSYDHTKLELLDKAIQVNGSNIIDIQLYNENIDRLQDQNGIGRIIFGLRKNAVLMNELQKTLAVFTFKAIDIGQAEIGLISGSQLIQETNNQGVIDYSFSNPQLPLENLSVQIVKKAGVFGAISSSDGYTTAGTEVKLSKDGMEPITAAVDADGNYEFSNMEDGTYTLTVTLPGYETSTQEITVTEGQDEQRNVTLQRIIKDADRNGIVELEDLVFVASRFGLGEGELGWNSDADINQDGVIDMLDILFISRELE